MDDLDLRLRLEAAVRRNRVLLTVCALPLAALAVTFVILGSNGTDWFGTAGFGLIAAAGLTCAIDAWVPTPRPEPRLRGGKTVIRTTALPGTYVLLGALGFSLLLVSFALGDGLLETAAERRGGLLLLIGVPVTPVLLVWSLVLLARPDRLALSAHGVEVRRGGRAHELLWHTVRGIEVLPDNPGAVVQVLSTSSRHRFIATRQLGVGPFALRDALRHYRDHPADRAELGTVASVDRLTRPAPNRADEGGGHE